MGNLRAEGLGVRKGAGHQSGGRPAADTWKAPPQTRRCDSTLAYLRPARQAPGQMRAGENWSPS